MAESLAIWDNGSDFVIAESPEDCFLVVAEAGITWNEADIADMEWEKWPEDKPFPFYDEDEDKTTTLLPAQWVEENGRGYFASADS